MPASIKHLTDKKLNLTSLLARWKDGLYYTAAIVKCDKANKKCLVCFEDGSELWANNRDVHIQLSLDQLNEDEDIVCCICDDGNSEPPNEIILCDVCQQGYHQKCHTPPVDSSKIDESEETSDHKDWFCATCSYILNQSNRAKLSANAQQETSQKPVPTQMQPKPKPKPQQQIPQPQPQQQPTKLQQTRPQPPSKQSPQQEPSTTQKQPAKTKQTPITQQLSKNSAIGPIKTSPNHAHKQAPYYPLSSQVRVVATGSTAALASMTASSALVVGSSAGRTKQDLVNQGNRTSQRQRPVNMVTVEPTTPPPVKHAVRKSSVNFVTPPAKQSALPTATRSSILTSTEPSTKLTHHSPASTTTPPSTVTIPPQQPGSTYNHYSKRNNSSNVKSVIENAVKNSRLSPIIVGTDVRSLVGAVRLMDQSAKASPASTVATPVQSTTSMNSQSSGSSNNDSGPPSFTTNTSGKSFSILPPENTNNANLTSVDNSNSIGSSVRSSLPVIVQPDSSQTDRKNHDLS